MRFPWQKAEPLLESDVVKEFIECYLKMVPNEKLVGFGDDGFIEWQKADGTNHKMSPGKVLHDVALLAKNNRKKREEIYKAFIGAAIGSGEMPENFNSPEFRARLIPSIRARGYLHHMRDAMKTTVPYRDLNGDPNSEYIIAYSIDFPTRLAHVTELQAGELELDETGLYKISMQNLRERLPREAFRRVFDSMTAPIEFPCEDGLAGPRLLAISEYLNEGEELAVLVPDGAMLYLLPLPPNNNWNPLRQAANESSATGFPRPFLITKDRIRGM